MSDNIEVIIEHDSIPRDHIALVCNERDFGRCLIMLTRNGYTITRKDDVHNVCIIRAKKQIAIPTSEETK